MHTYLKRLYKFTFTVTMLATWFTVNCSTIEELRSSLEVRDDFKDRIYYLDSLIKHSSENSQTYFGAYLLKSELQRKKKQNVEALNSLRKILKNREAAKFSMTLANAYLATSDIYLEQKSYELAQEYVTEAFIIFNGLDDNNNKALARIKSATINRHQENFQGALRNLIEAHALYEQLDKKYETVELSKEIGAVAYQAGEFIKAEAYLLKALEGFKNFNDTDEQIKILESLSSICQFDERYKEQVAYQKELIDLSKAFKKPAKTSARLEALSVTYSKMGLRREALQTQERAVSYLAEEKSAIHYYAIVKLSELYKLANRETDAIMKLHEANSLALSLDDDGIIMESTKVIADFYTETGQWEKAVKYLTLADSINSQLLEAKIRRLEKNSSAKESPVENMLQQEADGAAPSFFTNWKSYMVALLISLLVLVAVLFINSRKRERINKTLEWKVYKRTKELRVLNSELNTYIYKSSHDLRNPLTSIKSLITLLKTEDINPSGSKYVDLIEDCANQMDEILLSVSRAVDYKKFQVDPKQIDFNALVNEVLSTELELASGIELTWNIREKAPFFSDPNLIKVILKKTILNSKQYRLGSSKDFCKVSITTDSSGAHVCIEDNGQGISEKVKDSVFDMFVKGTHKSKGAGLGLYLVKIASDKLKGNISLESEENVGSKIEFKLPNLV